MELKLVRETTMGGHALFRQGQIYIPASALAEPVGLWQGRIVFYKSPLAGKRICISVLSPDVCADELPPAIEEFFSLCTAAGANLLYHHGGVFPPGDLVLAIEPGGRHIFVNFLGTAYRSRPLATHIANKLKLGLKLAYLPDPVRFRKSQYNLKLRLVTRLFTPAIMIQWPDNQDKIGPWLFAALMEFFDNKGQLDGSLFLPQGEAMQPQQTPQPETEPHPVPEPPPPPPEPDPAPHPKAVSKPSQLAANQSQAGPRPMRPGGQASMSRAQYPDFFAKLEQGKKVPLKRQPFR